MRNVPIFMMVALVIVLLAGCIAPPPVEEAQQDVEAVESELCQSIKAYAASLAAFDGVTADTTVEEVEELNKAADAAYSMMVEAWADLQQEQVQVVESAVAEFDATVTDVPDEATLGDAATSIQESAATLREAVDQLDAIACVPSE